MKKKLGILVVGGIVAMSTFGFMYGASAAEKAEQKPAMHTMMPQDGKMDMQSMKDMMKNPEMQKQCLDAMRSPEMQAALKQMMQRDGQFHQMMLDLVNSVDMDAHSSDDTANAPMNHSMHH